VGKIFVLILWLKQIFLRTTKYGGTKNLEGTAPECPHVAMGLVATITIKIFVNIGMITVLSTF